MIVLIETSSRVVGGGAFRTQADVQDTPVIVNLPDHVGWLRVFPVGEGHVEMRLMTRAFVEPRTFCSVESPVILSEEMRFTFEPLWSPYAIWLGPLPHRRVEEEPSNDVDDRSPTGDVDGDESHYEGTYHPDTWED